MLTTSKKQLVERIIEKEGELFRVIFAVYSTAGERRLEVVKVIALGTFEPEQEASIALPVGCTSVCPDFLFVSKFKESFVSPFLQDLIFINGSKPRAPTLD